MRVPLPKRCRKRGDGQRGSVLLLVLILSAIVGGMAASFGGSSTLQRDVSRDVVAELKSDLARQSGLEYARRQLRLDPYWEGMDGDSISFGDGASFSVNKSGSTKMPMLSISGSFGESEARLTAMMHVECECREGGSGNKALVFLGKELKLKHVHVHGNMLVADTTGVVDDWVNDPGGGPGAWVAGGPDSIEGVTISKAHVWNSTLYNYTDTNYKLKRGVQAKTSERAKMPAWDLSSYLVPGPEKIIYTDQTHIRHLHTTKTLVVVADPGEEIHIENSHIDGGIVIWCENTYDLRGEARNSVKIENCHIGGGASTAGVIAPACAVEIENNQISGFCFIGSTCEFENNHLSGQLIVVNELEIENAHIYYDAHSGVNPPIGITHGSAGMGVEFMSVKESY